ncbi:class I SAM-dependent methyltransferase [Vreelandella populi]|uniref:class I SAM-dependent methyltransferase n=1 Tax=Vreelandella populi TaxID=2498858 RepID=UPI000F8EF481|nr:class I SAM-dependent methyltransferase [Halomonas populi]RUR56550.1 class I SAM-dependent methyltransferase [Halomonas populi]
MNENDFLKRIATFYHSKEAKNGVDHFHISLRDILIPENGGISALELGCGSGRWTKVLCERYVRVDTVDASNSLIDDVVNTNKRVGAELTGHVDLVEDFLTSTKKTWQHVYLTMLLEHVYNPVDVLALARKVCEPDGTIFIAVPNATSVHRVLAVRAGLIDAIDELSESDHKVGHRRVYTPELLTKHILEAGLTIAETIPIGLKPITHKQMQALPDDVLWALCYSGDLVPNNSAYLAIKAKP